MLMPPQIRWALILLALQSIKEFRKLTHAHTFYLLCILILSFLLSCITLPRVLILQSFLSSPDLVRSSLHLKPAKYSQQSQ